MFTHERLFASVFLNVGSRFHDQHMAMDSEDVHQPRQRVKYEDFPWDESSLPQEEKVPPTPSFGYPYLMGPEDIGYGASAISSFPPQKTEVDREDIPELSFYFPPVAPIQSDPTSGHGWPELDSGFSCEAAHGSYYPTTALTQECWENYHQFSYAPLVQGDLYGTFPHPTGMNADIPMGEAMDGSQDAYDMFHLRSLARHSALKGHKYDPAPHQLGGQEPYDRRFTCTFPNCGKRFSGEWEKSRHVKSMHCPPTIGCRKCNYKQSRKDLFSEHCKKRHPGESIEDLRVRLDTPGA